MGRTVDAWIYGVIWHGEGFLWPTNIISFKIMATRSRTVILRNSAKSCETPIFRPNTISWAFRPALCSDCRGSFSAILL